MNVFFTITVYVTRSCRSSLRIFRLAEFDAANITKFYEDKRSRFWQKMCKRELLMAISKKMFILLVNGLPILVYREKCWHNRKFWKHCTVIRREYLNFCSVEIGTNFFFVCRRFIRFLTDRKHGAKMQSEFC